MRDVPEAFNRRLALTFGAAYRMRWNEAVGRYELLSPTVSGGEVSQFWCRFRDPVTGERLAPDPVTRLHPYRDLDPSAQDEIVQNLHESNIARTGYGAVDWDLKAQAAHRFNRELMAKRRALRAATFADLIGEVDLRRPWVRHHSGSDRSRHVAQEHGS